MWRISKEINAVCIRARVHELKASFFGVRCGNNSNGNGRQIGNLRHPF